MAAIVVIRTAHRWRASLARHKVFPLGPLLICVYSEFYFVSLVGYVGEVRLNHFSDETNELNTSHWSLLSFIRIGSYSSTSEQVERITGQKAIERCPIFCPISWNLQKVPSLLSVMEDREPLCLSSIYLGSFCTQNFRPKACRLRLGTEPPGNAFTDHCLLLFSVHN